MSVSLYVYLAATFTRSSSWSVISDYARLFIKLFQHLHDVAKGAIGGRVPALCAEEPGRVPGSGGNRLRSSVLSLSTSLYIYHRSYLFFSQNSTRSSKFSLVMKKSVKKKKCMTYDICRGLSRYSIIVDFFIFYSFNVYYLDTTRIFTLISPHKRGKMYNSVHVLILFA